MRKLLCTIALVVAVVFGMTVGAKADTQQFTETGPNGPQTLTVNTNLDLFHIDSDYTFYLSGASGFTSGSCSWFSQCIVTAVFDSVFGGTNYRETTVDEGRFSWLGWGWGWTWTQCSFGSSSSPVQAPEESSRFELASAALALALVLPRARKLQSATRA